MSSPDSYRNPLKVLSSMAPRDLLAELATCCARDLSQRLITEAAGGVDVAKRVQADEPVDIVVLASNAIDKLMSEGKLRTGSRVDLAKSGVAIAVRKNDRHYEIASEDAVKAAVLAARNLGYSTGPSGTYLQQLFERWGILQAIREKIVVPPPGIAVGTLVARGECELGFQQMSELMNVQGIDVLGPLPPSIQTLTVFSGGITVRCNAAEDARRVLDNMESPAAAEVKRRYGMEPAL
jgi:molybdate transport system substrate-binding protein